MSLEIHPDYLKLKERLTELIYEYNELIFQICPNLEFLYVKNFGVLEYTLYKKDVELSKLKRKLRLVQIQINNGNEIDIKKINRQLENEFKDYQSKIEKQQEELEKIFNSHHDKLSEEDTNKLKKIYKKCVFALHPDLNGNLSNHHLRLFTQITEAFKNGDLETLESLYYLIPSGNVEETSDLDKLNDLIEFRQDEIKKIKQNYPYNKKELLSSPERIDEYKLELKNLINQFDSDIESYTEKIQSLM